MREKEAEGREREGGGQRVERERGREEGERK